MLRKFSILLTLLMLLSGAAEAQYNMPRGRIPKQLLGLSVGGHAGATVYFGDLVDAGRVRWTIGGFAEKHINSWFLVRAGIDLGQVHGSQVEGIEFKTFFTDIHAIGKVHFLDLIQGYYDERPFNPYFGIGAGGIFYNCKKNPDESVIDVDAYLARAADKDLAEKWLYYDGGMKISGEALGLLGVRYQLNNKLWLTYEIQGNIVFTDQFDAHQGWPDSQGNWIDSDGKFDCLWTTSLGVQYRFYNVSKYTNTSKYSRQNYLKTRKIYERNAKRMRRR